MLREASEQRARAYLLTFVSGLLWFGLGLLRVCIRYGSSLLRVCFGFASGLLRVCIGFELCLLWVCFGFASDFLRVCFGLDPGLDVKWPSVAPGGATLATLRVCIGSSYQSFPTIVFIGFASGLHRCFLRVFLPEFPYHSFPTRVFLPEFSYNKFLTLPWFASY